MVAGKKARDCGTDGLDGAGAVDTDDSMVRRDARDVVGTVVVSARPASDVGWGHRNGVALETRVMS